MPKLSEEVLDEYQELLRSRITEVTGDESSFNLSIYLEQDSNNQYRIEIGGSSSKDSSTLEGIQHSKRDVEAAIEILGLDVEPYETGRGGTYYGLHDRDGNDIPISSEKFLQISEKIGADPNLIDKANQNFDDIKQEYSGQDSISVNHFKGEEYPSVTLYYQNTDPTALNSLLQENNIENASVGTSSTGKGDYITFPIDSNNVESILSKIETLSTEKQTLLGDDTAKIEQYSANADVYPIAFKAIGQDGVTDAKELEKLVNDLNGVLFDSGYMTIVSNNSEGVDNDNIKLAVGDSELLIPTSFSADVPVGSKLYLDR